MCLNIIFLQLVISELVCALTCKNATAKIFSVLPLASFNFYFRYSCFVYLFASFRFHHRWCCGPTCLCFINGPPSLSWSTSHTYGHYCLFSLYILLSLYILFVVCINVPPPPPPSPSCHGSSLMCGCHSSFVWFTHFVIIHIS
jgi:hypothetical protein